MSYREIPEDRILKFPSTAGFKGWRDFFTDESVAHPAKMNLKLLRHILEAHTSPGDIVLDPMAGTGSTIVLASMLGRNGIAVEYEPHFCDMIRENIKRTKPQSSLMSKGSMTCLQGDARELSKLLEESDAIITSPPYSESIKDGNIGLVGAIERASGISRKVFLNDRKKLKEAINIAQEKRPFRYSNDLQNIGNLPHGDIEAIITSPPYGSDNANLLERKDKSAQSVLSTTGVRAVPLEEGNIGVLKYGVVDAIVLSPPYEATCLDGRDVEKRIERLREAGHDPRDFIGGRARGVLLKNYDKVDAVVTSPPYADSVKRGDEGPGASGKDSPTYNERLADSKVYSNDPTNIGNLKHRDIDSIVTSPPYEQTISNESGGDMKPEEKRSLSLMREYSEDSDNIGNLKSESYLEAMLQCYREYFKVLRKGGVMVLVTKNFIRDKAVVRLDLDTISLAESAGFTLEDRWYFKLPTKSFWRILYERKYPSVPKILYEDVLVFRKEAEE